MKRLIEFLKPYWKQLVLVVVLLLVQTIANLYLPEPSSARPAPARPRSSTCSCITQHGFYYELYNSQFLEPLDEVS